MTEIETMAAVAGRRRSSLCALAGLLLTGSSLGLAFAQGNAGTAPTAVPVAPAAATASAHPMPSAAVPSTAPAHTATTEPAAASLHPAPAAAPVAAATATSPPAAAAPAAAIAKPAPAVQAAAPVASAAVDNGPGEFYGPVKPAESLWSIANRMRPNKQISTEQVLVAIYRANPRAFYGSINSLNEGAVLRVPNIAEMTALPPTEARLELQRLWSAHPGETPPGKNQPLIDPLQITPPPPAQVGASAGDGTDAATADSEVEPSAAVPAEASASEAPGVPSSAALNAAPAPAADANPRDGLQTSEHELLAQLTLVLSTAAATVSAWLANPGLDQLFAGSFAVVVVLVLLLAVLRRLLAGGDGQTARPTAPAPAAAEHATQRIEPVLTPSSRASETTPFAAVLAATAEATPPAAAAGPTLTAAADPVEPVSETEAMASDHGGDPISTDEIGTKLDLARAYIEMGEKLLARVLLREVLQQGDAGQRADAEALLDRVNQG